MLDRADALTAWADEIPERRVILLGMGGSSLGPLVLAGADGRGGKFTDGRRSLQVVDTTDPKTLREVDCTDALIVISSKSGTTLETDALFAWALDVVDDPHRFVVITDIGSPLVDRARALGVRRVFENPTDIGGRYSLFSYFGMVPAALLGYDVAAFSTAGLSTDLDAAAALGAEIGQAVVSGHDKLFITSHPDVPRFGLWAEQLIAESTGKNGTGCIPVPTNLAMSSADQLVLSLPFDDVADLAAAFYALEVAIAICGSVIGVDPFNEPNVAEAKERTLERLSDAPHDAIPILPVEDLNNWLERALFPGAYLALQAYIPFAEEANLEELRDRLAAALQPVAVTAGFGPRYLHSTGQLHKGGPRTVVALQIVSPSDTNLAIPSRPFDFATLLQAQADGDFDALQARGQTVARVEVGSLTTLLRRFDA